MKLRTLAFILLGPFGHCALASNCPTGGTTIFFGNGILTTEHDARGALWELQRRVDAALDASQPQRDKSCVQYSLAYDSEFVNNGGTKAFVTNVVGQFADAAVQAGLTDYATVWSKLFQYSSVVPSLPDSWAQALGQDFSNVLITITAPVQTDLQKHINLYQTELNAGNNVIVVAHSQGNLYVNEAFVLVSIQASAQMRVVAVATPSDHVAGGGPWVTLQNDIISLVPNALPSNTTNNNHPERCTSIFNLASRTRCHDFTESYLTGDVSGPKIINAVTALPWSVSLTFEDGGKGSGVLLYDASSRTMVNWSISVSGGNTIAFPPFSYAPADSFAAIGSGNAPMPERYWSFVTGTGAFGDRELRLVFLSSLTDAGGTVGLDLSKSFLSTECFNCSPIRNIVSGSVTAIASH